MRERIAKDTQPRHRTVWREAGPRWEVKDVRVEHGGRLAPRESWCTAELAGCRRHLLDDVTRSMARAMCMVEIALQARTEKVAMMPRFGTELVAAPGLENITWYGRGPEGDDDRPRSSSASASTRAPWTRSGWSTCARRRTATRRTCAG